MAGKFITVGADQLAEAPATPGLKLEPQIVQKIAERVAIFAGIPQAHLLSTLAIAEVLPFKTGVNIFREGESGDSFFVVIVGSVAVQKMRDNKVVKLTSLGVGECFGEMALVRDEVRSATVVAERDSVTLCFARDRLAANPVSAALVYKNMAGILAKRLDDRTITLADYMAGDQSSVA